MKIFVAFLVLFLSASFQATSVESKPVQNSFPTGAKPTAKDDRNPRHSFSEDQRPSPMNEKNVEDLGLVEVKETEIPEDSEVYVLEEEEKDGKLKKEDEDEIMETASNIVFRPLFRYRSKQQALRRNQPGIRRRYFVPKRYYRRAYYPYYYRHRVYYY